MNSKISFLFPSIAICALAFSACSDAEPQTRIDVVNAMTTTLASVEDKITADAAAPKFLVLVDSLDKFGETPESEVQNAVDAVSALMSQAIRLEAKDYFESDALRNAMTTELIKRDGN